MSVKAETAIREPKTAKAAGVQPERDGSGRSPVAVADAVPGQRQVPSPDQPLFTSSSPKDRLIPSHALLESPVAAASTRVATEEPIEDVGGAGATQEDSASNSPGRRTARAPAALVSDGASGQDASEIADSVVITQEPAEPTTAAGGGKGPGDRDGRRGTGGGGRSGGGPPNESGQPKDADGDDHSDGPRQERVIAERETVTDIIGEDRVRIIEASRAVLEIGLEITDKNMRPLPEGDGILTEDQKAILDKLLEVRNRLFYDKEYAAQGVADLSEEVQPALVEIVDTQKSKIDSGLQTLREETVRIKTELEAADIDAEAEKMLEAVSNGHFPESDSEVDDGVPFLRATSDRVDKLLELIKATPRERDMDEHKLAIDAEKRLWLLDAFTTGAQLDPKRLAFLFDPTAPTDELQEVVIPPKEELNDLDLGILAWNEYINAYNVESVKRREHLPKSENERRAKVIAELAALGMKDEGFRQRHRDIIAQRQILTDVRESVNAYDQESEEFVAIVATIREQVETMVAIPAELMLEELRGGKAEINGLAGGITGPQNFVIDTLDPLEKAEEYLADGVGFLQGMKGATLDLPLDSDQRRELNKLNERPIRNRLRPLRRAREAREVPAVDGDFKQAANTTADILRGKYGKRDDTVKAMERGFRESDPRWETYSPAERGILITLAMNRMNTETMEEIITMQRALAAVDQGGEQIASYRSEMSERYVALDTFKNSHPNRLEALAATFTHLEQLMDNGVISKEIVSALLGWNSTDDAAKRRTALKLLGGDAIEDPIADFARKLQTDIKNIRLYLETGELEAGSDSSTAESVRLEIPGFKDNFSAEHKAGEGQPVTQFSNEVLDERISEVPAEVIAVLGEDRVRVLELLALNLEYVREVQGIPKPLRGDPEETFISAEMEGLIEEIDRMNAQRHRTQKTDGWISLRTRAIAQQLEALSAEKVPEFVTRTATAKSRLEELQDHLPPRLKEALASHQEAINEVVPDMAQQQERLGQIIDEILSVGAGIEPGEPPFLEDPRIILEALLELGHIGPSVQMVEDVEKLVKAERQAAFVDTVVTGLRKSPDAIDRINALGDPTDLNSAAISAILEEVIPLGQADEGVRMGHRREASEHTDIDTWNETIKELKKIEITASVMYALIQQRLNNYTQQPTHILAENLNAVKKSLMKESTYGVRGKDQAQTRDRIAGLEAVEAYVRDIAVDLIEAENQFGFVLRAEDRITRMRLQEAPMRIRLEKLDQELAALTGDAAPDSSRARSTVLDTVFDGSQNALATAINTQINGDSPEGEVKIRQSDIGILTALATESLDVDAFIHEINTVWQTGGEQRDTFIRENPVLAQFMEGHPNAEAALYAALGRLGNLDDEVGSKVESIFADNGFNLNRVVDELVELQIMLAPAEQATLPAGNTGPQPAAAEQGAGQATTAEQSAKPERNEPAEAHLRLATPETVDISHVSPDVIRLIGEEKVLEIEWLRQWFDEAGRFRSNDLFEQRRTPHTGFEDKRVIERAKAAAEGGNGDAIRPIMVPIDLRNARRDMNEISRVAGANADLVGMGQKGREYHEKIRPVTESEMALLIRITGSAELLVGNIDTEIAALAAKDRSTIPPGTFLDEATAILGRLQKIAGWLPTGKTIEALKEVLEAEKQAIDMGVYHIGYELADETTKRTYDALATKIAGLSRSGHTAANPETQALTSMLSAFRTAAERELMKAAREADVTAEQKTRSPFAVRTDINRLQEAPALIDDMEAAMRDTYGELKHAVAEVVIDQINPLGNRLLTLHKTVLDLTPELDDSSADAKAMLQQLAFIEGYVAGHAQHLLASEKPMGLKMPEQLKETLQVLAQRPVQARFNNWETMLREKAASAEPVELTDEVIALARKARVALNAGFDSRKEPELRELRKTLTGVSELTGFQRWILVKIAHGDPGVETIASIADNLDAVRDATTRFLARDPQLERLKGGQQTESSYTAIKTFADYCRARMAAEPEIYQTVNDVMLSVVNGLQSLPPKQRSEVITSLAGRGAGDVDRRALGEKLDEGFAKVKEYLERGRQEAVQVFPPPESQTAAAAEQVREQVERRTGESMQSTAPIGIAEGATLEKTPLEEIAERAKATLGKDITLVNDVVEGGIGLEPTESVLREAAENGIELDTDELAVIFSDLDADPGQRERIFTTQEAGLFIALLAGDKEYLMKIHNVMARINERNPEDEELTYLESEAGKRGPTIRKLRGTFDLRETALNLDDFLRDPVLQSEYLTDILSPEQIANARHLLGSYLRQSGDAVVFPRHLTYSDTERPFVDSEDATDDESAVREGEVKMKVVPAADLRFLKTLMDNVHFNIVGAEQVGLLKEVWNWKRKTFSALEPDEEWGQEEEIREIAPDENTDMAKLKKRLLKDLTKGEKSKLDSGDAEFIMERIQWLFDLKEHLQEQFPDMQETQIQYFQSKRPVLGGSYLMAVFPYEGRLVCVLENPTSKNATYIIMEEVLEAKGKLQSDWEQVAATRDKRGVRSEGLAIRVVHARLGEDDELPEDNTIEAYHRAVMAKHNERVFEHMDIKLSEIREGTPAREPRATKQRRRAGVEGSRRPPDHPPQPELSFEQVQAIIDSLDQVPPDDTQFKEYLKDEERFFEEFEISREERLRNPLIPDYDRRRRFFPDRAETRENFINLFRDMRARRADPKSEPGVYLQEALRIYNSGPDKKWNRFVEYTDELFVKMDHYLGQKEKYDQLYAYYQSIKDNEEKHERLRQAVDHPLGLLGFRIFIDTRINELLEQFEAAMGMPTFGIDPTKFYRDENKIKRRQ